MAHYEINRIQDRIIVVSDADTTEVSLTPLNGTETDYFIEASTDHMWKRVGSDVVGYDYTDLGAIGGGGGGGNVVDTLAATLGAGNTTGGNDIIISSGDLITDDGAGAGVQILSTGGAGINLQTPTGTSVNNSTNQFQVIDLASNQLLLARTASGNPQVTLGASAAGNGTRLYLNDVNKSVTIRTDTDDVEIGINGAGETGFGLKVEGSMKVTGVVVTDEINGKGGHLLVKNGTNDMDVTIQTKANASIFLSETTSTILLTAVGGVSTSDGLNVAGATGAGTTDMAKMQINGDGNGAPINYNNSAPTSPNNGDMWRDDTHLKFRIDGSTEEFMFTAPGVDGTIDAAFFAGGGSLTVANGKIAVITP